MFGFGKNSEKVRDPICGMSVDKTKTKFSFKYKEDTLYFCSQNCKDIFVTDNRKEESKKKGGCC